MKFLPALLLAAIAGGFGWLFYVRYWLWRDCINEALSSCVTPDGDNLTAGGMIWGGVAGAALLLAVASFIRTYRR